MKKHHYFVAVKLPQEAKRFLDGWIEERKGDFPFARWVHPADYHITLAFLGFAEQTMLNKLTEQLKPLIAKESTFTLTLNSLGTFGPHKAPRIFWADVETSEQLNEIQLGVRKVCEKIGFELDPKPFRPHITLARKWNSGDPFDATSLSQIRSSDGEVFTFQVTEIVLYETHLDCFPKYHEYRSFPLASPGA